MSLVFAFTLFVGAGLLFWVQPMFARMALPLLGGTPAVWNTCCVFFQAALLAGYGYAHLAPAWLGVRRQAVLHLGLLLVPLLVLPIAIPASLSTPTAAANPTLWLLELLLLGVGLPFFAVATTAPLLQRWFASTGHPAASDPYFLYAASNLGSMLALLSYPALLEPLAPLDEQSWLWSCGYLVLLVCTVVCAVLLWCRRPTTAALPAAPAATAVLPWTRRLRWIALAFVPSSLMLSVTTYLTTDVAPIPLLWVIPLALYLLTFILAFTRRSLVSSQAVGRALPLVVLLLVILLLSEATEPVLLVMLLPLLGLFLIALFCHGELARDRPGPGHLTGFYFWLSAGGVLGGTFNALLAPLLFTGVTEYPLILVLACLLRLGAGGGRVASWRTDVLLPLGLLLLTVVLVLVGQALEVPPGSPSVGLMFGLPAVICYTFLERPLRFALGIGALLLAGSLYQGVHGRVEYRIRSFFGVHTVTLDAEGKYRQLIDGYTVHGVQSLDPARRREPLAYYHRDAPIGKLFAFLAQQERVPRDVAVIGLGAGSLAAYGRRGQRWTFYEIDPTVVAIARDSGYFTYLHDCPAAVAIVLGDARLQLDDPDSDAGRTYDLLVIDAFSSDALPVHLFTREALRIYRRRLNPGGVLAFHISNRYLDMQPVLAALAQDAGLGCLAQYVSTTPRVREKEGKFSSQWVVMGDPLDATLAGLARQVTWERLAARAGQPLWRDAHTHILGLLKLSPGDP